MVTERRSLKERAVGSLGLVLLGLVGWTIDRVQRRAPGSELLAGVVIGVASGVGWIADHLPPGVRSGLTPRRNHRGIRVVASVFTRTPPGPGEAGHDVLSRCEKRFRGSEMDRAGSRA